jgi:hypothetical protein
MKRIFTSETNETNETNCNNSSGISFPPVNKTSRPLVAFQPGDLAAPASAKRKHQ